MTATYVLTLPLKTELWQEHILNKRFEIGRKVYNACLQEILKRDRHMKRDQRFQQAIRQQPSKERTKLFRTLEKEYGVTEYALYGFGTRYNRYYKKHLPSAVGQKVAKRAWETFDRFRFDKRAKKIHFKRFGELRSLEGHQDSAIMIRNGVLKMKGLAIPVIFDPSDEYETRALQDRVKYCRILKKTIKHKERFFVQVMLEGIPPKKSTHQTGDMETTVGIDIGTQVVGIATPNEVQLRELAPNAGLDEIEQELRRLNRKRDRQRRTNNPHNYHPNGTAKKGNREPWVISRNEQKTKHQIQELYRRQAVKRKLAHQQLANEIIALGLDVRVEDIDFSALAKRKEGVTLNSDQKTASNKRFGKSIANKAPAMLIQLIDQKLSYKGLSVQKLPTMDLKITQFNHVTKQCIPQDISQRWDDVAGDRIQRNLYNAFLIQHTTNALDQVDTAACHADYPAFKQLHDKEIDRLRALPVKHPSGFGF